MTMEPSERLTNAYNGLFEQSAKTAQLSWDLSSSAYNTWVKAAQAYQAEAAKLQRSATAYATERAKLVTDLVKSGAQSEAIDPTKLPAIAQEVLGRFSEQDMAIWNDLKSEAIDGLNSYSSKVAELSEPVQSIASAQQELAKRALDCYEATLESWYGATAALLTKPSGMAVAAPVVSRPTTKGRKAS